MAGEQNAEVWRDSYGHFRGGLRVNVDSVPRLPAWAFRWLLEDPRKVPYMAVWTEYGSADGALVHSARLSQEWPDDHDLVLVDPGQGVRTLRRKMPGRGRVALLIECYICRRACRNLYGGQVAGGRYFSHMNQWVCRRCAGLRYASEGFYVRRGRGWLSRLLWPGGSPGPEPWDPFVFSHPSLAAEALGVKLEDEPLLREWVGGRSGSKPFVLPPPVPAQEARRAPVPAQEAPPQPALVVSDPLEVEPELVVARSRRRRPWRWM